MKENAKVIYFLLKRKGVQCLVSVKIKFEKCTTNFHLENGGVDIKTAIVNW